MYIMNFIVYGCGILLLSTLTTGQQRRPANECTASEWFGCLLPPCFFAVCPRFPEAICSVETKRCGGCRAIWTIRGQEVDCKRRTMCPPGVVEMENCADNLCQNPYCPDVPTAVCVPDICGHCEEDYYQDGIRVDCFRSLRSHFRQFQLMMRQQQSTSTNGPSVQNSLTNNGPVPIVITNSPVDPVIQSPSSPDFTGVNPNIQRPVVVGNFNDAAQFSASSPNIPLNNPIDNIPARVNPSNPPVAGPLDSPVEIVPRGPALSIQSSTPGANSMNQGANQPNANPTPSNAFDTFRVDTVNEPASGFNAFSEFGIGGANEPQPTSTPTTANMIPETNPQPVEPFNSFAEFGLGGPNEAPTNAQNTLNIQQNSAVPSSAGVNPRPSQNVNPFATFDITGPVEPIGNVQSSRGLITPQNSELPPSTQVERPSPSNVELLINSQPNLQGPSTETPIPFQASACVQGYVRRNCTENACAGQTCNIVGAKCFESNCGTCRAEWYLNGRSVECSSECPPNVIKPICNNPCSYISCPAHPNAICRVNKCGVCTAEFFVNNQPVSCDLPSDNCPVGQEPKNCVCHSNICPMNSQARCRIVGCGRNCSIKYYKPGVNGLEEVPCGWYTRKRT